MQAEINFEIETGCKLIEFLGLRYTAGAGLTNTQSQEQARILESNKKMLGIIDMAVEVLRKKGWTVKCITGLFIRHLSKQQCKRIENIISLIAQKTEPPKG